MSYAVKALADVSISSVNREARAKLGIRSGDTVRVWQKIQEKGKTRLQAFEGLVLAVKHGSEPGARFVVRRVSGGMGIEKNFPLYSPMIDKIEILRRSKVRRAKLYFVREKVAKEIRRQMRNMRQMNISVSESEAQEEVSKEEEKKTEHAEPTPEKVEEKE